jgi:hypothetical protein
MHTTLILDEKDFLAKGGERSCYIHPEDNKKLVKVIHAKENLNQQNDVEEIYMNYLDKRSVDLSHIAKYYGKVSTNLGDGLIYERVLNYDGSETKSLRYSMVYKTIPLNILEELLQELKNYLEKNRILFVDTSLTNIFCKKIDNKNYKLIIVDGLGAKRLGFKFWLYRHCKIYTKYKIKRQWTKLMSMYYKDVKRIEVGVRPIVRL